MKVHSLFGVVGAGFAALALAAACTVTTNNDGGVVGDDSGNSSGGNSDDSGATDGSSSSSSSSSSGAASSSGSGEGGEEAGEGAAACAAQTAFDPTACDTCVKAACCDKLVACEMPDDAGLDDAGNSACMGLFIGCVLNYHTMFDAGIDEALSTCTSGSDAGANGTVTALVQCIETSNCTAQCY
jgi:hypothetical protein